MPDLPRWPRCSWQRRLRLNCIAPPISPNEMSAGSLGVDQRSKLKMEMWDPGTFALVISIEAYTQSKFSRLDSQGIWYGRLYFILDRIG